MKSICGSDCCEACPRKTDCGGCQETGGHPFGGVCVAAKCIQDSGFDAYQNLKQSLIQEIQALGIPRLGCEGSVFAEWLLCQSGVSAAEWGNRQAADRPEYLFRKPG